jgi:hypothetical protein
VKRLTIEAVDPESARGFCDALSGFDVELVENGGGAACVLAVTLGNGDREIVELLNAIERYLRGRNAGPALIGLEGNTYMMEPG